LCVKSLEKLFEVALSVVWSRRRLGMVLHGKDRVFPMPDALDGVVVQVKVCDLEGLSARNARGVAADREAVILGRYKYLTCREIADRVVSTPMAIGQFDRVPAERQA
jgi:hypothetical protein